MPGYSWQNHLNLVLVLEPGPQGCSPGFRFLPRLYLQMPNGLYISESGPGMLRSIPVSVPGRIYISRQNDAKSSGRIKYVFLLFIRTPLAAAGGVLVEGGFHFFPFLYFRVLFFLFLSFRGQIHFSEIRMVSGPYRQEKRLDLPAAASIPGYSPVCPLVRLHFPANLYLQIEFLS